MNSHCKIPMPSTILQFPIKSSLLNNPIIGFTNKYRPKNHFSNLSDCNNNGLPIEENSQPNMVSHRRVASKLRVNGIVARIKPLTSEERREIIISEWKYRSDFVTISDFNDVLMALLVVDEPQLALKLFDELSSHGLMADSWTLSLSIRCHCKNKGFDEAERVLGHMLEHGLHPNNATIALLIDSLSKFGKLTRALSVLDEMGRVGFRPRIETRNRLLKGLCYVGRVDDAVDMLMGMKREDLNMNKPDICSYTTVMNGLCKVGRSDEAFELLAEALETGLKPDALTFNTLFHGYCVEGRPIEGARVLSLMKERNCEPDSISYSTLLYGLLKWREISTALRVYEEMVGLGFEVEDKMLNTLLIELCRGYCKREKDYLEIAQQLFEKMKREGSVVNPSARDVMIQTLCVGKRIGEARANLQSMIRMGYSPRIVTFNGVIRELCVEGKVVDALLLLALLNEGGRVPNATCYDLLIHELNRRESSSGACSLYGAALKQGVVPRTKPQL